MQPRIFHLHALSALHCGVGQAADVVDLPIARARATHLPIVPGSSLRGVLRAQMEGDPQREPDVPALFGPREIGGAADAFAGALAVGDAHLLLLPVRSLAGIVCYATSPFILRRYRQDLIRAGQAAPPLPNEPREGQARVVPDSVNRQDGVLFLEDLDLPAQEDPALRAWAAWIGQAVHPDDADAQTDLVTRFALLPDNIMHYLAETATEIRTRIAIDPATGTVKRGALWYEENLPAESVLWGVQALSRSNRQGDDRDAGALAACLPDEELLQLGGKAGVGRGLVRLLRREVSA
ncbi:CRISPR-associated RAMP Cmr4 [Thioalkalivibrio nitratireducens DSM 14787]|uniref:CRISPR-associated RAMP Cmr4 n=1 Tax=Thioalkalivibrio nitratireducens (strain DSM 14787 / UNIQEM 213 / ALEN2) TaxID=1255043 RepID=L0DXQ1_THIND|nr:type III-B CRISPR module RAMP protein Cmr4 [Thioalkalivibrio nitratireducens]AGA33146.1 CRISPR-associated RAMP Cmr4 [Thioalkalivibrio nitratireducens DSM 14787]